MAQGPFCNMLRQLSNRMYFRSNDSTCNLNLRKNIYRKKKKSSKRKTEINKLASRDGINHKNISSLFSIKSKLEDYKSETSILKALFIVAGRFSDLDKLKI